MALVKAVILVDGENLVMRYQEMLSANKDKLRPKQNNIWEKDVFVWNNQIADLAHVDIFSIKYYTSSIGDDDKIFTLSKKLAEIKYLKSGNFYSGCQISPYIYKKDKQSNKVKIVDINIAVEAMRMAYSDSVDVIFIVSGDSDFIELYQDIMKRGKQVLVAALSSGLHPKVPIRVDRFFDLDTLLFEKIEAEKKENNT